MRSFTSSKTTARVPVMALEISTPPRKETCVPYSRFTAGMSVAGHGCKAMLCTKPLAMNGPEALEMLEAVEKAGIFNGYLEDSVYTPKTLKALAATRAGALGKVLWACWRETHAGPHSDWFWIIELSGGGAIVDMGCFWIEIARSFVGKGMLPKEVTCWVATQVHPIEAEDHAVGLVRYENGAIGQFEVTQANG
jgi:predicted dehydrogenase